MSRTLIPPLRLPTRTVVRVNRRLLWIDLACKAALILALLHAVAFPDLPQYDGKGIGSRLFLYPISTYLVPIVWWIVRRKRPGLAYPYLIDICVCLPFMIDTLGNTFNLYNTIEWWDDVMHFVTWVPWVCAFGLLIRGRPHLHRFDAWVMTAGFGAKTHILWEIAEYFAFIKGNPNEYESAYKDTLGDLALSLCGSLFGSLLVATVVWNLGRNRVDDRPPEGLESPALQLRS